MRKGIIISIAICILLAAGFSLFMIFAINNDGINVVSVKEHGLQLVNTQQISLENITSIEIEYTSDDVVFYASDTDELILKEYKTYTPEEDELSNITTDGNGVSIRGGRHKNRIFSIGNHYSRNDIYLPAKYAEELAVTTSSGNITSDLSFNLSQFTSNCHSGDVTLNEVHAKSIKITSSSGNITIQKAEGEREISSHSGDIKVYGGNGESTFEASSGNITIEKAVGNLTADANSGNIRIMDSEGEKEVETSSGNITIENSTGVVKATASSGEVEVTALKGAGRISTKSGNIKFELKEVNGDIELEASSGNATLIVPDTITCNFNAEASSGNIKTFFDDQLSINKNRDYASGTIGDNPSINIQMNTMSGNIRVEKQ